MESLTLCREDSETACSHVLVLLTLKNSIFQSFQSHIVHHFQDETKAEAETLEKVSIEEILEAQRVEQERRQEQEQLRARFMKERGLQYTAEIGPDDMYQQALICWLPSDMFVTYFLMTKFYE